MSKWNLILDVDDAVAAKFFEASENQIDEVIAEWVEEINQDAKNTGSGILISEFCRFLSETISKTPVTESRADKCDFALEIYSRKTDNFIEQVVVDPILNNILGYAKKNPTDDDMKYVVIRIDYKIDDDGNEEEIGTTVLYDDLAKSLV